ncbi:hypothetical protein CC2G_008280 [Coprinopsis cinerea AmutBmut pab1-1]|nr:hypothetical protein CC2G_008280 [Coprinopsis cinerea AmutBmut pab1-1]
MSNLKSTQAIENMNAGVADGSGLSSGGSVGEWREVVEESASESSEAPSNTRPQSTPLPAETLARLVRRLFPMISLPQEYCPNCGSRESFDAFLAKELNDMLDILEVRMGTE